MGDGDPGVCGGIAARKNSSGRSSPRWFWRPVLAVCVKNKQCAEPTSGINVKFLCIWLCPAGVLG